MLVEEAFLHQLAYCRVLCRC